ncbi:hypothetical protein PspLS_06740 [Pyricularia sp. CBS 133598]|nr:hypothetical protein PspLS_06740 [Pyricularia sp. CBS 133598]
MVDGATEIHHLIIVCGHGIWQGGPQHGHDEAEWLIENYKRGETPTFIEHIKAGLEAVAQDSRAVLAFSGGPTWKETRLSEARSYANLAAANEYFGCIPLSGETAGTHPLSPIPLSTRIILEEQALDSYYNVLFAIIAFWRKFQTWPEKLTVVSHAFKKARIVDAHCAAIGFPLEHVHYIGINPPNLPQWLLAAQDLPISAASPDNNVTIGTGDEKSTEEKANMMRGVAEVIGQWIEDPHGAGDALAGKRNARNPWGVSQKLFSNDDERARSGLETVFLVDGTEALASTPTGIAWAKR